MSKPSPAKLILTFIGLAFLTGCLPRLQVLEHALSKPSVDYRQLPRKIWERKMSTPAREAVVLNDKQLLITTYRGELYLLDLQSGKRLSRYWTPFRRPVQILSLDILNRQLYIAGVNEPKVWGYDLQKGRVIGNWRLNGLCGVMVRREDDLYAVQDEKLLLRLEASNLKPKASTKLPARWVAGLFTGEKDFLMAMTADGQLRYFDYNLKSQAVVELNLNSAPVVYYSNDTLLAADSKGKVICVYNDKVIWAVDCGKAIFSRPIFAGEMAFIAFADGEVQGLNLKTGKTIWQRQNTGLVNLPLQYRRGVLFVPMANGKIIALDAQQGTYFYELDSGYPLNTVTISNHSIVAIRRDKKIIGWQW
jgi:outer membrane protein assembly factor BamB